MKGYRSPKVMLSELSKLREQLDQKFAILRREELQLVLWDFDAHVQRLNMMRRKITRLEQRIKDLEAEVEATR